MPLIKQYLDEGNNSDAPGQVIPYLLQHTVVYAYMFKEMLYEETVDINHIDSTPTIVYYGTR